jgi:hypothetical protein
MSLIIKNKKNKSTWGISTEYLISSNVIQRGSKGRIIPLFLFSVAALKLPTLADSVLDDTLLRLSFFESALSTKKSCYRLNTQARRET